jgi:hypothetical protein
MTQYDPRQRGRQYENGPVAPYPQQQPQWGARPQDYYPPQPPPVERKTVTVQTGSNAFHWTMTILTCGAWLLVWPMFRRKVRVTTKYR